MFAGLMVRSVTVKRPLYGETDRYGNDEPTWSDATSWYDTRCWVQPTAADEEQDDKERRITEHRIFMQPNEELEATYRIELDGTDFEVIGEPQLFYTPRGAHHYELTIRKVEG